MAPPPVVESTLTCLVPALNEVVVHGVIGRGVHFPPDANRPEGAPADLPPRRFVADSPLEGTGFELTVPP